MWLFVGRLREAYVQTFDTALLGVSFTVDEVMVAGDSVAYALTRSPGTIAGKDRCRQPGVQPRAVRPGTP